MQHLFFCTTKKYPPCTATKNNRLYRKKKTFNFQHDFLSLGKMPLISKFLCFRCHLGIQNTSKKYLWVYCNKCIAIQLLKNVKTWKSRLRKIYGPMLNQTSILAVPSLPEKYVTFTIATRLPYQKPTCKSEGLWKHKGVLVQNGLLGFPPGGGIPPKKTGNVEVED